MSRATHPPGGCTEGGRGRAAWSRQPIGIERIGEFWGHPETRTFGELLIDLEEDKAARAVVFGLLAEMERNCRAIGHMRMPYVPRQTGRLAPKQRNACS
jgi:hypothetical protein